MNKYMNKYLTFENTNGMSHVNFQDFIWLAQYMNNTSVCEFGLKTKQKNNFYSINRNALEKFGLIGQGMKLYFDTKTGIFHLNGQQIMFSYKTDEKEYNLTGYNLGIYNDVITYKDAYTDADPRGRASSNTITQYNFGYKIKLNYENGTELNFQAICSIPYNVPAFMQIKLVSNKDFPEGKLYIKRVGSITEAISAPLRKGFSGNCNWTIR